MRYDSESKEDWASEKKNLMKETPTVYEFKQTWVSGYQSAVLQRGRKLRVHAFEGCL